MVYQLSELAESMRAGSIAPDAPVLLCHPVPAGNPLGPDPRPRGRQVATVRSLPRMDEPEVSAPPVVIAIVKSAGKATPLGRHRRGGGADPRAPGRQA